MGRRRNRDDDWVELVARLAGLLLLASLISPQVRQAILAVGFIGVCVFALAVVGLFGFGLYRLATRSRRSVSSGTFVLPSITYANAPPISVLSVDVPAQAMDHAPQTTA
jgi:hypothetical protein